MTMTIDDCFAHIPERLTPEIEKFAIEKVFKHQRYIFTTREGKQQYGYCTYCQDHFPTAGLRHGMQVRCSQCGSKCVVKASGRGRKTLINEAYFTYYLKSAIDPNAIVAIGLYAVRDFSGCYKDVQTKYVDRDLFVFRPGGGVAFHRWNYYSMARTMESGEFYKASAVKCQFNRNHNAVIHTTYSRESIKVAVKGTPYQYSTWEQYDMGDMTNFFDLYSRYPCVEYLTKLGFEHLIIDKLTGDRTYSAVNWRGKNPLQVLRLTKQELKIIKSQNLPIDFLFLRLLQLSKKDGSKLTLTEALELSKTWGAWLKDWMKLRKYGSIRRVNNYLTKILNKDKEHYNHLHSGFIAWRDYISDCVRLDFDMTQERILFPRNLYQAHQNTIKQVKIKADEELNKKISDRAKILYKKYYFEHQGLLIRPAQSSNELIAEGKSLNHCVGTYAERYAAGESAILFIRKISEPDKPYFTVEIKNNTVTQVRGLKNCNPDKKVTKFMDAFKSEKLRGKKPKSMTA